MESARNRFRQSRQGFLQILALAPFDALSRRPQPRQACKGFPLGVVVDDGPPETGSLELWIDPGLVPKPMGEGLEARETLEPQTQERIQAGVAVGVDERLGERRQHARRSPRRAACDPVGIEHPDGHPLPNEGIGDREPDDPSANDEDVVDHDP